MHTVPLDRSNLGDCAWLASAAYAPNPFFKEWLRPHATSFPDHNRYFFCRRLKGLMHSPRARTQVMVSDSNDEFPSSSSSSSSSSSEVPAGTPMGFASWQRHLGPSELATPAAAGGVGSGNAGSSSSGSGRRLAMIRDRWPARDSAFDGWERWALGVTERYHALVRTDRSYDADNLARFRRQMGAIRGELMRVMREHTPGGGCIYVDEVVVEPRFQGRGVGRRLVGQGVAMAEQEAVPIGLVATLDGAFLYRKLGFKTVGEDWLLGKPGHEIMVYWPEGREPKDLKKFKVVEGVVEELE